MKKPKAEKSLIDKQLEQEIDDCEALPEEFEEDYPKGVDDDLEEDTTKEIMVDDFRQFKEDTPADWEG